MALACLAMIVAAALVPTAGAAGNGNGPPSGSPPHGNGNGHGPGHGHGKPPGGGGGTPAGACDYYYEWLGITRFPLQPDPHATYTYIAPSLQASADGVGFLVRGEFPHAVWTSWMAYTGKAQPYDVANFVNNPPDNTNNPIVADAGSVDPFTQGQPMQGTPRKFTQLWTPQDYSGPIAASLDGTVTADVNALNKKNFPSTTAENDDANFWVLANRVYQAFPGYNPGGSTESTFPVVTAVDLATGDPVDCEQYNQFPDALQNPASDPPDQQNYTRIPENIVLKNGQRFFSIGGLGTAVGDQTGAQYGPDNPGDIVQWTRPPLLPGADVAVIPPSQNCAGYLGTKTDPRRVTLIRIPQVANVTDNDVAMGDLTALYPNRVNLLQKWQAAYSSLNMYGTSPSLYLPGDPDTGSLNVAEMKPDASGGATVMVWPRTLNRAQQRLLFRYANARGWAIMRGGTQGAASSANMLFRIKASASDFPGRLSSVPCYFGTTQNPVNTDKTWVDVPTNAGSTYAAASYNAGPYAIQSVACERNIAGIYTTIAETVSGRCARKLAGWISATGGSYFSPQPPDPDPGSNG